MDSTPASISPARTTTRSSRPRPTGTPPVTQTTGVDTAIVDAPGTVAAASAFEPTSMTALLKRWVSYTEAATLAHCHPDTIRNDREAGKYLNAEQRGTNGQWFIPISDLIAAGRLTDEHLTAAAAWVAGHPEDGEVASLREELAAARALMAGQSDLIGELRIDLAFLRAIVTSAVAS